MQQYSTNVQLLLQQRGSRLRDCVTVGSYTGKAAKVVEQIGEVTAQSPHQPPRRHPLISTRTTRWVHPTDYEWADMIDDQDKVAHADRPDQPYAMNGAYALGRAMDNLIITAAWAPP